MTTKIQHHNEKPFSYTALEGQTKGMRKKSTSCQSTQPISLPAVLLDFFKDKPLMPSVPPLNPLHTDEFYRSLSRSRRVKDPSEETSNPESNDPRLKWLFVRTADLAYAILMSDFRDPIMETTEQFNRSIFAFRGQELCIRTFPNRHIEESQKARFPEQSWAPGFSGVCVPVNTLNAILDGQIKTLQGKEMHTPGPATSREIDTIVRIVFSSHFEPEKLVLQYLEQSGLRRVFYQKPNFFDAITAQIFRRMTMEVNSVSVHRDEAASSVMQD